MTPLSPVAGDGTQIWKITHNGVDTHPIHFHLFNVQLINRVGWDGAIRPPDANELGWKETVRVNPLEDTIVALRPVAPESPSTCPTASGRSTRCSRSGRHDGLHQHQPGHRPAVHHVLSPTRSSTSAGSTCGTATSSATKRWT